MGKRELLLLLGLLASATPAPAHDCTVHIHDNAPLLSREAWLSASSFLPGDDAAVREIVLARVDREVAAGRTPVVIFDLDGTVYDTRGRAMACFRDWLRDEGSSLPRDVADKLGAMTEWRFAAASDAWRAQGIEPAGPAWDAFVAYWLPRYLSARYLHEDRAYEGAAAFARLLHSRGAHVVFLTARDRKPMEATTLRKLSDDGFPVGVDRTQVITKESKDEANEVYKRRVSVTLRAIGPVVASFENEPINLVALAREFPEAVHVFVVSGFREQQAPPVSGIYRIDGYR